MHATYYLSAFLATCVIAGLAGAATMTAFMSSITRFGITHADMVTAIGSAFTRTLESARLVGLILHGVSGVVFATIYAVIIIGVGATGVLPCVAVGATLGFFHGFVLSFILVTNIAEHHPLPEFQEAGMGVAVAHLLGHVVYGTIVGLVIGASHLPALFIH